MVTLTKCTFQCIVLIILLLVQSSCNDKVADKEPSEITIIIPTSANTFINGYSNLITWTSNFDENVNIELWKGGEKVSDIATNIENTGSYEWMIEELSWATNYGIKIISSKDSVVFSSSGAFTITTGVSNIPFQNFTRESFEFDGKTLELFTGGTGEVTLVFEHGMGDNGEIWFENGLLTYLSKFTRYIVYSRSGMGGSTTNGEVRGLENITKDLHAVIENHVTTEKIILVGHSWGGPIIQYYTTNHPERINALFFIDPSADFYFFNQAWEDASVEDLTSRGLFGVAAEAEQIVETMEILRTISNLPDIPVVLLSNSAWEEGFWKGLPWTRSPTEVEKQTLIGSGVTDFTQILTPDGHYIHSINPVLVYAHLNNLITKVK